MTICKFSDKGVKCETQASFGEEGDKQPSRCSKHRLDGMVNVVSKHCLYDGCNTQPSYGMEVDKKASYCFIHKKENMINIKGKRCLYDGCKKQPSYGMKLIKSLLTALFIKKMGW
jgi:hypothetical protein